MKGHERDPRWSRRRRDTCILWSLGLRPVDADAGQPLRRRDEERQEDCEPEQRDQRAKAERPQNARVAAAARPARVALVALHCLFVCSLAFASARVKTAWWSVVLFFCLGLNF